jgi:hypothetical protein
LGPLAILIDAENVGAANAGAIISQARKWGDSAIVRIFGDFTANRHAEWCELARTYGFELVTQLNGGKGKNSTDIVLTIHAMDLLYGSGVDGFCIVSNDRDFLPLAMRLKAAGKKVYAVCDKLDERMTAAFTKAIALAPPKLQISAPTPPKLASLPPIVAAFREVSGDRSELTLGEAGKLLRRHSPKLFEGASKNGAVRKLLKASGRFVEVCEGNALRIRLKAAS